MRPPVQKMSENELRDELSQLRVLIHLQAEGSLKRKRTAERVAEITRELKAFDATPRHVYPGDRIARAPARDREPRDDEPTTPFVPRR